MKKIPVLIIILLVVIASVVYIKLIKPQSDNGAVSVVVPVTIEAKELDFSFVYSAGESGYTLIEPPVTAVDNGIQKIYLLLNTKEYAEFTASGNQGEAPPTVSIFVFELPEVPGEAEDTSRIIRLLEWSEQTPEFSSVALRTTEPEVFEVDGVKSVRYKTEGTYRQEVYLANHKGRVYVFTGQYKKESDDVRTVFTDFMKEVVFN